MTEWSLFISKASHSTNITVTQVYTPTTDTEEAVVDQFYEDLEDLLELTPKMMFYSSSGIGMQK